LHVSPCGGFTLAKGQPPTQLLAHALPSAGWGEIIGQKSLQVEIKAGKLLTSYCCGQNRL